MRNAYWMTVYPEKAEEFLLQNKKNRPVSQLRVSRYAEDMKNDRWLDNGQPIIFDERERLLTGQHRLLACIKAGVSFETLIVQGISGKAQRTMDVGMTRKLADDLHAEGASYSKTVAAALGAYEPLKQRISNSGPLLRPGSTGALSHSVAVDLWKTDKDGWTCAAAQAESVKKIWGARGAIGALVYILQAKSPTEVPIFFRALASGEALVSSDPIYQLREKLLEAKTAKHPPVVDELLAMMINAWNAYRKRISISKLQGTKGDKFPVPI